DWFSRDAAGSTRPDRRAPGVPGLALLPGPSACRCRPGQLSGPGDRVQGGSSISDKLEQRGELAGSKHLANGRLDVAEDQSAAVLPRFAVQGDKNPQRRRSRETDAAEINHQLRTALLAALGFILRSQVLYRGRVESPAIPELRDQDPFMLMDLNRGLQHESPVQKRSRCSSSCWRSRSGRFENTYE